MRRGEREGMEVVGVACGAEALELALHHADGKAGGGCGRGVRPGVEGQGAAAAAATHLPAHAPAHPRLGSALRWARCAALCRAVQVLAGIGVEVAGQMSAAPKQRLPQAAPAQREAAAEEDELIARLAQLK